MKSCSFTLPDGVPSVNHMFGQAPGRKRFKTSQYANWIKAATYTLRAAKPLKFFGTVEIEITYPDRGRFDLTNRDKDILDLLVSEGVIVNDSRKYVRRVVLSWGDIENIRVVIAEAGALPTITYSES